MKRSLPLSGRLAACLTAVLLAWPCSAARAQVISVTVGVTPTCPLGLAA
jgi:hypothetical protein